MVKTVTTPGTRPVATEEDANRADSVMRAWYESRTRGSELLPLRGLLVAAFADCRHDAYADALADHRAASSDPIEPPACALGDHAPMMDNTCALCGEVVAE
jgi:hypothetical protein